MITEIVKIKKIKFPPVEIKLTIETEEDLAWLWAIANSSPNIAKDNCNSNAKLKSILESKDINHSQMKFFETIDIIAEMRGYGE